MSDFSLSPTVPRDGLAAALARVRGSNRLVFGAGVFYLAAFALLIVLSTVDRRLVTGAPVWIKPMKFLLSMTTYTVTIAWMLSYARAPRWLTQGVGAAITLILAFEVGLIVMQAARGVSSHFNFTTEFDGRVFELMGIVIVIVWTLSLFAAILLLRQRDTDPATAWSLRLGLLVTLVGMLLAFQMIGPTPDQAARQSAGEIVTFQGAHSVGVADGGPGLPFTGWSTAGGDLRVAHFAGIHALQIIPLMGWAVRHRYGRLAEGRRVALVVIGGLGYLGFILLLQWQALRGQPLLAPDALTAGAFAGLLLVAAAATRLVVGRAR